MNVNAAPGIRANADTDPITLQIIRHELIAIPNQIERNIERTAFSPLVQEYKDYSVGFVDPDGHLHSDRAPRVGDGLRGARHERWRGGHGRSVELPLAPLSTPGHR